MKAMKKLAAAALSLCLTVPMFSTVVSAANGSLMFSDPQTKVGEEVSVDLVVKAGSAVGDADVTMSYDSSALQFESGDGITDAGDGKLTYSGSGDGTATELRTTMTFKALKMGDTSITVDSSKAYLYSDESLTLAQGSSAIKIDQADDGTTEVEATSTTVESTDISVSVNGTDYSFSEAFVTSDIPAGYSETTKTFNGEEHKFVANEAGVTLGFLVDGSGAGKFFLYNEEDSSFSPYTELKISDTTSIILLTDIGDAALPSSYQKGELTVADQSYPYWADPENDRYDLVYAVNTRTGEKGFYQYDSQDGTYQSTDVQTTDSTKKASGFAGKLDSLVSDHPMVLLLGGVLIIVVLLVLMIMFAVKLIHRNQELDDLYDEYDIPFDDEEEKDEPVAVKKSDRKIFGRKKEEDDDYDDGYDDDYNDDFDDDDYDDYEYDEYDDYDDYDDAPSGNTRNLGKASNKKAGRSSKGRKSDDYDMDFIDL